MRTFRPESPGEGGGARLMIILLDGAGRQTPRKLGNGSVLTRYRKLGCPTCRT